MVPMPRPVLLVMDADEAPPPGASPSRPTLKHIATFGARDLTRCSRCPEALPPARSRQSHTCWLARPGRSAGVKLRRLKRSPSPVDRCSSNLHTTSLKDAFGAFFGLTVWLMLLICSWLGCHEQVNGSGTKPSRNCADGCFSPRGECHAPPQASLVPEFLAPRGRPACARPQGKVIRACRERGTEGRAASTAERCETTFEIGRRSGQAARAATYSPGDWCCSYRLSRPTLGAIRPGGGGYAAFRPLAGADPRERAGWRTGTSRRRCACGPNLAVLPSPSAPPRGRPSGTLLRAALANRQAATAAVRAPPNLAVLPICAATAGWSTRYIAFASLRSGSTVRHANTRGRWSEQRLRPSSLPLMGPHGASTAASQPTVQRCVVRSRRAAPPSASRRARRRSLPTSRDLVHIEAQLSHYQSKNCNM